MWNGVVAIKVVQGYTQMRVVIIHPCRSSFIIEILSLYFLNFIRFFSFQGYFYEIHLFNLSLSLPEQLHVIASSYYPPTSSVKNTQYPCYIVIKEFPFNHLTTFYVSFSRLFGSRIFGSLSLFTMTKKAFKKRSPIFKIP